ncbi:ribonuclease H-like domain-containing protein [Tanacetum coccineum]
MFDMFYDLGGILLRFWSDYVLTAIYLINRLSSSVLNGKSPFELVYKQKPNLSHLSPNDDGKDSSVEEGSLPHSDGHSTQGKTQSDGLTATQIDDQKLREGFDYDETFSHVVKMVTVRCLIGLAVVNNRSLYQLDVNNTFLYGDLVEDVYMTLPDEYNNKDKSKVCKLNMSLYGLKQAPRQWNAKLTTTLAEHGFEQSKFDYSLYTKHIGDKFIALLVYVDDIVITGNDDVRIKEFKLFLSTKFLIKDLGVLKYFLEVIENNLGLCMSERKYYLELSHEYGLLAARPVDIPILENSILSFEETKDDKYLFDFTTYQKLVVGVQFYKHSDLKLKAFADVDWAKCPKTRRYVTGLYVFLGKTLMSWKSKNQATISKSSSEAEYKTIQIAANPIFHERTKHFELDVHLFREKVLAGIIKTVKVSSNLQTADIFTKCLSVVQHRLCCKNLGIQEDIIWCMSFVDNIILVSESAKGLNNRLENWREALEDNGLRVSLEKTEYLRCYFGGIKITQNEEVDICIRDKILPPKESFRYLGSMIHKSRRINEDVSHRIKSSWLKWRAATCVLCDRNFPIKLKGNIYRVAIWPAILYDKTMLDMIPNGVYRAELKVETIINQMREGRLGWFRHVKRRPQSTLVRKVKALVVDGSRRRGRPKLRCLAVKMTEIWPRRWSFED